MLTNFVENNLPSFFVIINDKEGVSGQDLFLAFLKNCENDDSVKKIDLICSEYPPFFYLKKRKFENKKINVVNYFSDPCEWNNLSSHKSNFFAKEPKNFEDTAVFIDSVTLLTYHFGFLTLYRKLNKIKNFAKKIVCVVHGDLLNCEQLEELNSLALVLIKLESISNKKNYKEKSCELIFKKQGGKVIKQMESFCMSHDYKIISKSQAEETSTFPNSRKNIEGLTTFELGLYMSEKERKAKDELVLPYLKTEAQRNAVRELNYQLEMDELEDPDDDLDI